MNSPDFVSKKEKKRQTDREKERQVKRENKILKAEFKKADRHTFLEEVVARSMISKHLTWMGSLALLQQEELTVWKHL